MGHSCDVTTPISGTVCHLLLGLTIFNPHTKFEVSTIKPATDEPGCPAGLPGRTARPGNPVVICDARAARPGSIRLVCRGTRTGPVQRRISVKIHCNAMLFRCPAGRVGSCVATPVQPGRVEYVVFILNLLTFSQYPLHPVAGSPCRPCGLAG